MRAWLPLLLLAAPVAHADPKGDGDGSRPLAGLAVRSRDYVIRRTPEGRVEELTGDVYYRRREMELKSDWALIDHGKENWQARGHVRGTRRLSDGLTVDIMGDSAHHDQRTGRGRLSGDGRPVQGVVSRPGASRPDKATARLLEWDDKARRLTFSGDVKVDSPDGEARGEAAVYSYEDGTFSMTGRRPFVRYGAPRWTGAVQGDKVGGLREPLRLKAEGAVKGWLYFPEAASRLSKP